MKSIDSAELTGYLDRELSPERTREVEAALATDAGLREQLNSLRKLDMRWRTCAEVAMFSPEVAMPIDMRSAKSSFVRVAIGVAALLAVRIVPKLVDQIGIGVLLHGLALIAVVWWLARVANEAPSEWTQQVVE